MKLASCKNAPPLRWFTLLTILRQSSAVLVLLFVALWFILRGDLFYALTLCYFVLMFFSPFSIAITLLGEERANLNAFCMFV